MLNIAPYAKSHAELVRRAFMSAGLPRDPLPPKFGNLVRLALVVLVIHGAGSGLYGRQVFV